MHGIAARAAGMVGDDHEHRHAHVQLRGGRRLPDAERQPDQQPRHEHQRQHVPRVRLAADQQRHPHPRCGQDARATFTQESGGDLVENIASASSFGKLHNPSGSDSLGGTLTLDTASGYSPPPATKFLFMTFSSETGKFASNVFNGHIYSVKYDPADVTLSALDNTTTTVGLSPAPRRSVTR
jgi:hypothetical protein